MCVFNTCVVNAIKCKLMDRIELINMEFFAHHGCFCEEQIIGNKFIVNFWVEADLSKPAKTDNIEDALNYQVVYNIIKKEVLKKSHLLEHVARRILDAVKAEFPQIEKAQVTIDKLNPPMGGLIGASRVVMNL